MLLASLLAGAVYADTVITESDFYASFASSTAFQYYDSVMDVSVLFTVQSGWLNGSASLDALSSGGEFVFTAESSGTLYVSASETWVLVKMNGITFDAGALPFSAGSTYTVVWTYLSPTPTPSPSSISTLPSVETGWIWQFLFEGDFLGALQSYFLSAFGYVDLLYGLVALLFFMPLYIKTRSLLLLCIMWILVGGFFVVLMPVVSGLAVLFMILGIGGLIYKAFRGGNQ